MDTRKCPHCNKVKSYNEFYKKRGMEGKSSYCKICTTELTVQRQKRFKKTCVIYKGGKCEHCGYNKTNSALEFHHRNPDEKDFSIARARLTKFNEKVKAELDKCLLLCANCHREEHERLALSN